MDGYNPRLINIMLSEAVCQRVQCDRALNEVIKEDRSTSKSVIFTYQHVN